MGKLSREVTNFRFGKTARNRSESQASQDTAGRWASGWLQDDVRQGPPVGRGAEVVG